MQWETQISGSCLLHIHILLRLMLLQVSDLSIFVLEVSQVNLQCYSRQKIALSYPQQNTYVHDRKVTPYRMLILKSVNDRKAVVVHRYGTQSHIKVPTLVHYLSFSEIKHKTPLLRLILSGRLVLY